MADVQDKGYGDKKQFICTACGKEIMLTKFASQKTCKCDDCKANNAPIDPDIVTMALEKNPSKARKSQDSTTTSGGVTKIRPCIKCGKETEVSKFMSDQKVQCDECKGVDTKPIKGIVQRLPIDMSKLDRSKMLPIEEYEVNEVCIRNSRLRSVTCPACGHNHVKPNMVADWSQFGLVISYQCPKCLLTMLISEQTNRVIKMHSPGTRFDYTGNEILGLIGNKEQSRYVNIIRKLIKLLDDNNIKIDDGEIVPYRWKNEKPVPIGYEVPPVDKMLEPIGKIIDMLDKSERQGSTVDMPEGSRYIIISHTLASKLSNELKDILKGEKDSNE